MNKLRQFTIYTVVFLMMAALLPLRAQAAKAWDGKSTEVYAGGEGTEDAPYEIANAKQLAYMAKMVNAGEPYTDTYFVLTADINLNQKKWTPIGTAMTEFQGHLDGRGHSISGLYIKKKSKAQGLFAYTLDAEISNISLLTVNIQAKNYVGALVGIASHTTIAGCSVSGEIHGEKYVGGFIGYEANAIDDQGAAEKLIFSCANKAKVIASQYVGGIAGYYKGSIYNSNNYGDVVGMQFIGGIAGYGSANGCVNHGTLGGVQDIGGICGYGVQKLSVTGCLNLGSITGNTEAGGICGYVPNETRVEKSSNYGSVSGSERVGGLCGVGCFTQSFNMGAVSGDKYVGGLSGYIFEGSSDYSYNRGKVKGSKTATYVGGIAGFMQTSTVGSQLTYCYNTGKISGKKNIGGVVGYNGGIVADTFYLVNQATIGIGGGNKGTARPKEAADMKSQKLLTWLNASETMYQQKSGSYPTLLNAKKASSSNLNTAKKIGKVTAFTAKAGKESVTLTWTPLQRVSGYEIYQYDKGKKAYVKKKTLTSLNIGNGTDYFTASCTVGKLKKNTTYKFRIRAYKEVAGKKYYGKYQNVSVKVK